MYDSTRATANDAPAFDPPDPESVYRNYLRTCRRLNVQPVPRERAVRLGEWIEVLTGRPEPITH